jgi:hypothetical protein
MRASWAGFRQGTRRLSREPIWLDDLVLVQQLIRLLQIVFLGSQHLQPRVPYIPPLRLLRDYHLSCSGS